MLDVTNINNHVPAELRSALNDLRRAHTSPAVIQVRMRDGFYSTVDFYDERFPYGRTNAPRVAALTYEGGSFILHSIRIKNRKFSPNVPAFREKVTKDDRKIHKLLREYIRPFSINEVIRMTDDVADKYSSWVNDSMREVNKYMGTLPSTIRNELLDEMLHLRAAGVQFRTPRFRTFVTEALPNYEEYLRRSKLKMTHMHVYVQPDGKVVVTRAVGMEMNWNNVTYDGIDAVPEHIRQQISMLKMVDTGQYIPEVGQRMAEDIYWIHVVDAS